jgi:hypothetical protein
MWCIAATIWGHHYFHTLRALLLCAVHVATRIEDEPQQSTGGEQEFGPSHPANTSGSGHMGMGIRGSGVSKTPVLATLRALATEEMGIMGSPGAARTADLYA